MNQGAQGERARARAVIFYPGMKEGVNQALREEFARSNITIVQELWEGSVTTPAISAGGLTYQGLRDIQAYVAFSNL